MFCVEYAKSVRYTDLQRPVIEEDIVKAIKFKLNNEEQAFRKQHEEQQKSTKELMLFYWPQHVSKQFILRRT